MSVTRIRRDTHAFGVHLTLPCWRLQILRISEQSSYVATDLTTVSTFEIFTSSAEESSPKLLPPNAFSEVTVPQKCVGGRALPPRTKLKELTALTQIPYLDLRSHFATEKGKGRDVKELGRQKGSKQEGKVGEGMGRAGRGRCEREVKSRGVYRGGSGRNLHPDWLKRGGGENSTIKGEDFPQIYGPY